eukprot:gene8468-17454_t
MPLTIDDFALGNKIGRGRFGHVYKVQKKDNKQICAMKVLYKKELQQHGILHQLIKEVDIQSKMKHKYVLRLLWVFQDEKRVYMFTDIAPNGNIYNYLQRLTKFPEDISGKYVRQLLNALIYLHQKKIVHRDIKPENLLIASSGNLLLADFGWCTEIAEDVGRLTVCGTPEYLPPEMITHQRYSDTVDSWTCGVLLYEFLTGVTPFTGTNQHEIYDKVLNGKVICPEDMSSGVKSFVSVALRKDPLQRYTAGELFLLPWTQEQNEGGRSLIDFEDRMHDNSTSSTSISTVTSTSTVAAISMRPMPVMTKVNMDINTTTTTTAAAVEEKICKPKPVVTAAVAKTSVVVTARTSKLGRPMKTKLANPELSGVQNANAPVFKKPKIASSTTTKPPIIVLSLLRDVLPHEESFFLTKTALSQAPAQTIDPSNSLATQLHQLRLSATSTSRSQTVDFPSTRTTMSPKSAPLYGKLSFGVNKRKRTKICLLAELQLGECGGTVGMYNTRNGGLLDPKYIGMYRIDGSSRSNEKDGSG